MAFGSGADQAVVKDMAYVAERQSLLQWQERQAEAARSRIKGRDGFSTLTADQAHGVLRCLGQAVSDLRMLSRIVGSRVEAERATSAGGR